MNEYLAEVRAQACRSPFGGLRQHPEFERWLGHRNLRRELVVRFAWAIPTDEAITLLCRYSPLVEVGAGTGYWAKLVREAGGVIHPFDKAPPARSKNQYDHRVEYARVKRGGPRRLARFDATHNLFLCWPPYKDGMAFHSLRHFRGRFLVYVGELEDGCNADERFFKRLTADWDEREELALPQWEGIHDSLFVYERKVWIPDAEA